MSNILVTGGNGFIGSHLVNALARLPSHRVTVFDLYPRMFDGVPPGTTFVQGNMKDSSLIRHTLEDRQIDVVYHAAWTSIHETALANPAADIETNLVSTVQLLDACCAVGVRRIVFISSGGTVYGMPLYLPVREDHSTNPINAYGVAKLAVEKYLQMYSYLYGLEYVIFRPSVPYGPRQSPKRRQGAVTVFVHHALRGEPITIWGDGEVVRDYFFVGDLPAALISALEPSLAPNGIFNLAGCRGYSLNALVGTIEDVLRVKMQVLYEPARKFDVPRLLLDTSAASKKLGWRPTTSLSEGVRQTAEWIRQWKV